MADFAQLGLSAFQVGSWAAMVRSPRMVLPRVRSALAQGSTPRCQSRKGWVDIVTSQISEVLVADSCRYIARRVRDARIAVLDHDGVLTRNGRAVDVERSGLPTDEYPTREQRRVAVLLADQVAAAR